MPFSKAVEINNNKLPLLSAARDLFTIVVNALEMQNVFPENVVSGLDECPKLATVFRIVLEVPLAEDRLVAATLFANSLKYCDRL